MRVALDHFAEKVLRPADRFAERGQLKRRAAKNSVLASGAKHMGSDGFEKVLRKFAKKLTRIHQKDGTRDKLVLAFGALDADGDKKLSFEEFRRVVAGAAVTPDPTLALGP